MMWTVFAHGETLKAFFFALAFGLPMPCSIHELQQRLSQPIGQMEYL